MAAQACRPFKGAAAVEPHRSAPFLSPRSRLLARMEDGMRNLFIRLVDFLRSEADPDSG